MSDFNEFIWFVNSPSAVALWS